MKFEKLGNIASIQIGRTPKRAESKYWGKGNTWVSISDLTSYEIINTKEEITDVAVSECNCKQIPKGTLLMSFKLSIGKLAFAGKDLYTNEAICGILLKDKSKYASEYLYYALQNTKLIGSNVAVKGATLNTASLNALQIPIVGNKETQLHIANILTKAESLIAQRKESIRLLDEYLKSMFLEMFGDPLENPNKFEIKTLKDFYINPKEGTKCGPFGSALKKHEYTSSGIPVWNMDNISIDGNFVSDINLFITEEKYSQLSAYSTFDGDIIISRAGTVGKMCVLQSGFAKSIISTNLIRVRLNTNLLLPIHFVSLMKYCKNRMARLRTGSDDTFTHMNTGILDSLKFPVPPLKLQTKYAQIVEKVEALKAQYQQSLQELENLYGSLSQKAFKGELNLKDESLLSSTELSRSMAAEPETIYNKK